MRALFIQIMILCFIYVCIYFVFSYIMCLYVIKLNICFDYFFDFVWLVTTTTTTTRNATEDNIFR